MTAPTAPRRQLSGPVLFLMVAAGYLAGDAVAFGLLHAGSAGAVLFPPAGVTLAGLVLSRPARWPWALAAAGLSEIAVDSWHHYSLALASGFALANVVEPLVGASLLRRLAGTPDLRRRRDLAQFVGCATVAGPLIGALIGTSVSTLGQHVGLLDGFAPYLAGDGLGVLTVAGTVLTWRQPTRWSTIPARLGELTAVLLAGVVTAISFWPQQVPLIYLPMPVLFWSAVRFGVPAVAASGLTMTLAANAVTADAHGPWAVVANQAHPDLATLQLFLAIAVLSAWVLAVEVRERQRARTKSLVESSLRHRVEALQQVTAALSTAATTEQIIETIAGQAIGLISPAGLIGVLSSDGTELRTWQAAAPPTDPDAGRQRLAPTRSVLAGQTILLGSASELAGQLPTWLSGQLAGGSRTSLQLPLLIRNVPLGVLSFGFDSDGAVDPDLVTFARTLAELAAQALDRARLYERDHQAAHQLQQALKPAPHAELPGVQAATRYQPAEEFHEVGGDWYDIFPLPANRVGFAVGDVVGHDLIAAAAMGRLQAVLRAIAATSTGPAEVLQRLDVAAEGIDSAPLATVGYGEYEPATGQLRYACAGHLPPLLATGDGARYLAEGRSQPLTLAVGVRPEGQLEVPPGGLLLWCTDGLVERRVQDIDIQLDRLRQLVESMTDLEPQRCCDLVISELAGPPRTDDIALICLRLDRAATG